MEIKTKTRKATSTLVKRVSVHKNKKRYTRKNKFKKDLTNG